MVIAKGFISVGLFAGVFLSLFLASAQGRRRRSKMPDDYTIFDVEARLPRFAQPMSNVTVTVDKDALLPCVIDNLGSFKVAWVRVDTQNILTIHHQVITRNPRISLARSDRHYWSLQIKNVQEKDRGWYMCQINTDPMRSIIGYLEVVVPPEIIDRDSSMDMVAKEGTNVTLVCKARGHPQPYIMWRREDNEEIHYNGQLVNVVDGEVLQITKVSRLHMGAYLCIASNGIPPSISKRIELKVQFPPMMTIPHQLESAYVGQEVTIECQTEAYPKSINYWTDERGIMLVSGEKYESFLVDDHYRMFMKLKIRNVSKTDFGTFKCVAKNSLGETDGNIKLYEIPAPTTTPGPHTVPRSSPSPRKHRKDKSSSKNSVIDMQIGWNTGRDVKTFEDFESRLGIAGESSVRSSGGRLTPFYRGNPPVHNGVNSREPSGDFIIGCFFKNILPLNGHILLRTLSSVVPSFLLEFNCEAMKTYTVMCLLGLISLVQRFQLSM